MQPDDMLAARILSTIVLLTAISCPALANEVPAPTIRDAIEGTWVLVEWNVDGTTYAPPEEATGRLSLRNNVIVIVLHRSKFGRTKSYFGFGSYAVSGSRWSYGYDRYTVVDETSSKVTVDHALPWQGLRPFEVTLDGQKVIFDYDGGKAQIVISGDEFLYDEAGHLVRKWKRIAD
jgi:hypothetical protein